MLFSSFWLALWGTRALPVAADWTILACNDDFGCKPQPCLGTMISDFDSVHCDAESSPCCKDSIISGVPMIYVSGGSNAFENVMINSSGVDVNIKFMSYRAADNARIFCNHGDACKIISAATEAVTYSVFHGDAASMMFICLEGSCRGNTFEMSGQESKLYLEITGADSEFGNNVVHGAESTLVDIKVRDGARLESNNIVCGRQCIVTFEGEGVLSRDNVFHVSQQQNAVLALSATGTNVDALYANVNTVRHFDTFVCGVEGATSCEVSTLQSLQECPCVTDTSQKSELTSGAVSKPQRRLLQESASDSCNYGYYNSYLLTEGKCNVFGQTYVQINCMSNSFALLAFYSDSECNSLATQDALPFGDFFCCTECQDDCSSVRLTAQAYTSDGGQCSERDFTSDIDIYLTQEASTCFSSESSSESVVQTFTTNSFTHSVYTSSTCSSGSLETQDVWEEGCTFASSYVQDFIVSLDGLDQASNTDSCNFGYYEPQNLLLTENYCNNFAVGNGGNAVKITCQYNGQGQGFGFADVYSTSDCIGEFTRQQLSIFTCCQECANTCSSFQLSQDFYLSASNQCEGSTIYSYELHLYQEVEGCIEGTHLAQYFSETTFIQQTFNDLFCESLFSQKNLEAGCSRREGDDFDSLVSISNAYPPTSPPTPSPSRNPTDRPSPGPTNPTSSPTPRPTSSPTKRPSSSPTLRPSSSPTFRPTSSPTDRPTGSPTNRPTSSPTNRPTTSPSLDPTKSPSEQPSQRPTSSPTPAPTSVPTAAPTNQPSDLSSFTWSFTWSYIWSYNFTNSQTNS